MKINWKEQTKDNILAYTVSGILILLVYFLFSRWSVVGSFFGKVWKDLMPFVWGFAIAFVLLPMRHVVEDKWLKNVNWKPRTKRNVAVTVSMVVLLLILASFFAVLIPQLSSSISTLAANMGSYLESASSYMDGLSKQYPQYAGVFGAMGTSFTDFLSSLGTSATSIVTKLVTYSISMVTGLFSFLIGLIVAIYMLLDQEKFKRQAVKMFYALLPRPRAEYWFSVGRLTSHMFNRFIFGKALDSFIIGIACWICCAIMRIPYSPLIAFIVGLTNMIPVFGPFIGAIPCILILLFINPVSAVEFAVFILILQQIDGNILGPYILGDSMGLPTLWVMFAIILGGSMFGVLGMFIGVPVFSVIYVQVRQLVNDRLGAKHISVK